MKNIFSKLLVLTLLTVSTTSLVSCGDKKCKNGRHNAYFPEDEFLVRTYVNGEDCLGGVIEYYKCSLCGEEYALERDTVEHSFGKLIQNGDEYNNIGCSQCERPNLFKSFTVTNPTQKTKAAYDKTSTTNFYTIEVSNAEIAFYPNLNYNGKISSDGDFDFSIKATINVMQFTYFNTYSSSWRIPCHIKFIVDDTIELEYDVCAGFPNNDDTKIGDYYGPREGAFNVQGIIGVDRYGIHTTAYKTNKQFKVECTILPNWYKVESGLYFSR